MRRAGSSDPLRDLLTPEAVRGRCHEILALGERGGLTHFNVMIDRLDVAADLVQNVMMEAYPGGDVPLHSRWRHFEFQGHDLWREMQARCFGGLDAEELARARIELAVVSVLLDAGAGPDWQYTDALSGLTAGRSEGLALASLSLFEAGLFGTREGRPSVTAGGLAALSVDALSHALQVTPGNPLSGLPARHGILVNLATVLADQPAVFGEGEDCRLAGLFDCLASRATDGRLPAREILVVVLELFNGIWPNGLCIESVAMGDVGRLLALVRPDATNGLVPFHKLSQWLAYSLLEPLIEAGIAVTDIDGLTGLAEYRNGGLFLDCGVIELTDPDAPARRHPTDGTLIVEWRALTVALLDRLAERMRQRLGLDREKLPLGKVLQGGTWAAGRRIAARLRDGGGPPLQISDEGAVF